MIEKIQNIIAMLKDYIKQFSKTRSYKFSVENAKTLLSQYENKLNTIKENTNN